MKELGNDRLSRLVLDALKANTETDKIEFKDSRGGIPSDLWKSITGFSNKPADGGVIVYGIAEQPQTRKFEVVGMSDIHDLTERTTNYFNDIVVNAERPGYQTIVIKGQALLAVVIDAIQDEKKPCYSRKLGMDRGACIRDGNTDRPITEDELKIFIRNSSSFKYDLSPVVAMKPDALDGEKIERLLAEAGERVGRQITSNSPTRSALANMNITVKDGDSTFASLAGALVFCKEPPQSYSELRRYTIRCIRYAGVTQAGNIIDSLDITGTLDEQIDGMQAFILRNIPRKAQILGTKRIESYEYPELAIREVVANAVIHRDYSVVASYIQVRVFDDRIEVSNPGNLPPGVTINNIKDAQFSRNSVIAALMRGLNYLEEYGRGVDLVFEYMMQNGLARPIFKNVANMFTVTLLGPRFAKLSERQLAVWQMILNHGRLTAKDILEEINTVSRPTIIADINRLTELGLVASAGVGRNTSYALGSFTPKI